MHKLHDAIAKKKIIGKWRLEGATPHTSYTQAELVWDRHEA